MGDTKEGLWKGYKPRQGLSSELGQTVNREHEAREVGSVYCNCALYITLLLPVGHALTMKKCFVKKCSPGRVAPQPQALMVC